MHVRMCTCAGMRTDSVRLPPACQCARVGCRGQGQPCLHATLKLLAPHCAVPGNPFQHLKEKVRKTNLAESESLLLKVTTPQIPITTTTAISRKGSIKMWGDLKTSCHTACKD